MRALVPGYGFDVPAAAALLAMAALLLAAATWAFQRRDYAAALWARTARAARTARPAGPVQRPVLRWFWSAALVRERYGLLAWTGAAALAMFMMARLEPSVVEVWNKIKLVQTFIGTQPGRTVADQYLSFAAEIIAPIVVAFAITRAAAWVNDLSQGRVELILAGPVSRPRLVAERLTALVIEVLVVTVGAIAGLAVGRHRPGHR